jgi:formylglycine-generating enzyme required for sulfatase activity
LTAGLQHRVKETVQIPRPEPADVLSLGVLPELGEHTARLAEGLQAIIERAPSFRDASRRRQVRGVPMGDGLVLIFLEQGDLALRVAMEAARGWRLDPALDGFGLRMGLLGAILPRESATAADARAAQPEIARAREVMRIAGADQILLPVDRMDSLRKLSGTAKGLVLLGERVLSDHSRIQLCSWHFRPPAEDAPSPQNQPDLEGNNRGASAADAPIVKTTPIVSPSPPPSVATTRMPSAPVQPIQPVQPVQSVTPVYDDAPATLRNEDLFAPAPDGASPVVWADSDEEADASEAGTGSEKRSGRGRFLLFLAFLLFAAAIGAGWYYFWYQAGESEPALPPVRMEFVQIRAGTFMMGADDREDDERPAHQVTLTRDFEIGKYEVTQSQWKQVMDGANPSRFKGDDLPVTNVSWQDATRFVERLTGRMKDQYVYRLPTEAEWEYCARSGTMEQESANLDFLAVYGQTEGGPRAVGRGTANSWSIYDMFGNVFEWCSDNYSARAYENSPVENPEGPATADPDTGRVIRGGGWRSKADRCRPGYRGYFPPDRSNDETGLRVVRVKR